MRYFVFIKAASRMALSGVTGWVDKKRFATREEAEARAEELCALGLPHGSMGWEIREEAA